MTVSQALRESLDAIPAAVKAAAGIVADYHSTSSPAEVADCASDQVETTCYLTPDEDAEFYAAVTREVYARFGIDSGASDGSDITQADLERVAGA